MQQIVISVDIRPHLVPFFYKEFEGVEASYLNKKVKACKITLKSSLGIMIMSALEKVDYLEKEKKIDRFYLYLTLPEIPDAPRGKIYQCVSGKNSFLKVPQLVVDALNQILEDQFRIAFVFSVTSAIKSAAKRGYALKLKDAFEDFMIEYELDNYGFKLETLRRLYNREVKKNVKMHRLQNGQNNRVLRFL
ncbi:hypothetical protein [Flavicella sp.]|uniref:hypothetical protein n=1 Tax=Flavicella sp. TaxID=2957742 RepID=UPI00301A43BC